MSVLSREKVILFWMMAEAASPRWQSRYEPALGVEGLRAVRSAPDPYAVPQDVRYKIFDIFMAHRATIFERHFNHCTQFSLVDVPPEDLKGLCVSSLITHRHVPVTLEEYLKGEYGADVWHDPRNAAKRLRQEPASLAFCGYPILAPDGLLGCEVLIEGYTRVIAALMDFQEGRKVAPLTMVRGRRAVP